MSIEINSKWVKDGKVVEVTNIYETVGHTCIWYLDKNTSHILVDYDFLEQYQPYEPVYEWAVMYQLDDDVKGEWKLHSNYFTNIEEAKHRTTRNAYNFQRVDFTKRERVCYTH